MHNVKPPFQINHLAQTIPALNAALIEKESLYDHAYLAFPTCSLICNGRKIVQVNVVRVVSSVYLSWS